MADLQRQVQERIDQLVGSGAETGLQVAAYHRGELVVDAVAGTADAGSGRSMTSETPVFSTSTGKGITATALHIAVERGLFDYATPVAKLWPEFAAHGKDKVTIRHVLTHTAGVPAVPADTTPEDLGDWERMAASSADAAPWWEPGTRTGYHIWPFGYIVGELIRRTTGRPLVDFARDEIAAPLGVADELYLAVPAEDLPRLARLDEPSGSAEMLASMPDEMFALAPRAIWPTAEFCNRADLLTSGIAAGGTMTARGIARMYAALLGEVDGVRLLPEDRLRQVTEIAYTGVDDLMGGQESVWGLGYGLGRLGHDAIATATVFGWPGINGSAAYADRARGTTFAITRTHMGMGALEESPAYVVGNLVLDAYA